MDQRSKSLPIGAATMPATARADSPVLKPAGDISLLTFARFGAELVHEVNNPLATALLSAQLALRKLRTDCDPRVQHCLENVIESVRIASDAIRNLVTDGCRSHADHSTFDIRDVLRISTMLISRHAEQHNCRLTWRVSPEPSLIFGNPIELEIAISELVRNAISAGAGTVVISSTVDDFDLCVIITSDTSRRPPAEKATATPHDVATLHASTHDELLHELIESNNGTLTWTGNAVTGRNVIISLPRQLLEPTLDANE